MATKLTAARLATAAGCRMAICLASEPERMIPLLAGDKSCGTVFHPHSNMLRCGLGCCRFPDANLRNHVQLCTVFHSHLNVLRHAH